ncbi:MAG: N-acetylmuramoyl-L-alanine amidase [Bacilli bacterium]|nr:N-acetylmuramoyl-L-alanine amidase [Bacilli bacterium]
MIEELLKMNINEALKCKDARTLFLYLYYHDGNNLDLVGNKILETGDLRYIHFLLRTFEIKDYKKYIDYILNTSSSASYLYYILYGVDYLDEETRLSIINRIIELNEDRYIIKSMYFYFNYLKQFNNDLYNKIKTIFKDKLDIDINRDDLLSILEELFYKEDYMYDYEGFTENCYKGRKDYIPNIIVCHINNTYGSAIKNFYDKEAEVSAHFVIRRDGYVKQVVSLDDSSWANGTSLREASDIYYRFAKSPLINSIEDNANYYTFSIEHESYDGSLTPKQLESSIEVMKKIIRYVKEKYNYDFIIDRDHIIGHSDVNPIVRTKCPGKMFPYDIIINELKKEFN